jgi:hypothetical protein
LKGALRGWGYNFSTDSMCVGARWRGREYGRTSAGAESVRGMRSATE